MPAEFPLVPCFRELEFVGGDGRFEEIAATLDPLVTAPWSRDTEVEKQDILRPNRYIVYRRDEDSVNTGLRLFFAMLPGKTYVSNIVPIDRTHLTRDEYNDALAEFAGHFAQQAAGQLNLELKVGSDLIDIREELDSEVVEALLAFSRASNSSTGSSHPMDRDRWFKFIVKLNRSNGTLSTDVLGDWLHLDGWTDDDTVSELQAEFEFGMGLLSHAEPR